MNWIYYTIFTFNTTHDYFDAMRVTSGPAMLELDEDKEYEFLYQHDISTSVRDVQCS